MGIDPGQSGGYAITGDKGVSAFPWDDNEFAEFCRFLVADGSAVTACVERVASRPGQGVVGVFRFGKSAGYIEGVLTACGIGYQLISPQKWKKEFSLIGKDKSASIAVCRKLFPKIVLRRTPKCRTDSDGMAEALLMAEYARRKL